MTSDRQEALADILRRVHKLLAIAQDDRANPQEAAAAAGMAERIMRKYQIDNSDLIMTQLRNPDELETSDCVANAKTNGTKAETVPPWANWLSVAVAQFNDCGARVMRFDDGNVGLRFYGYKADVQVCKYMFDYLVATINRLARQYKDTDDYRENGRAVLTSYRQGVSQGILHQLRKLTAEKQAEAAAAVVTGRSLMVVKQQAVVAKYGNVYGTKRSVGSGPRHSDAFGRGREDGSKVDVTRRGIGNVESSPALRLG